MSRRAWLTATVVFGVAVLVVACGSSLGGRTGWPWDALLWTIAFGAALAVATQRRSIAIPMTLLWGFVACPVAIDVSRTSAGDEAPGRVIARGMHQARGIPAGEGGRDLVDEGVHLMRSDDVPVGTVMFRRADKQYLNGESDYPDADLVAWSINWLPYPNVRRTVVHELGGNVFNWYQEDRIELRRDGDDLLAVGRVQVLPLGSNREASEWRRLGLGGSESRMTWIGWALIALAFAGRLIVRVGQHAALGA